MYGLRELHWRSRSDIGMFATAFLARLPVNIADKAIAVVVAYLVRSAVITQQRKIAAQ